MQNSIRETIKLVSCFSVFFLVRQADETQKKSLIKTIVIAALIISLYSIYQYFWGYQGTLDYLKEMNSDFILKSSYAKDILITKRSIGTFPSPNILGGYLIMALFLSLSIAESKDHSMVWYLAPFLIVTALILTKSMGAWLSFVSAFIIFFLLSYKSFKHKKIMALIFFIFISLAAFFITISRQERLLDLNDPQNSIIQRMGYWRAASGIIKNHFISGVGPGNFHEVFLNYKVGGGTDTRYAHNIVLHQWAETGITGLIAIIFLIWAFIKKAFFKSKYLFLAGLAFILHNFIDSTYFISQAGLFWWMIIGLSE
ncbi:MAG: O-antigen ligase family protein [Candidatus Omnitrophica bacterium]|nr:O-antigen ligase family protein [Candidatus Omnitrophota bacterium]MBU4149934.1 O-antigen ligase family protein [Candidatus Omnitrophota bacterium]